MYPRLTSWSITPELLIAWQAQVKKTARTPWLWRELIQHGREFFPRFASIYQRLRALPRRVRRVLQRKWACSLVGVALLLTLLPEPSWAATVSVSTAADLIKAINDANGTT